MNEDIKKVEEMLGIKSCICGRELVAYAKSHYLFKCMSCHTLYDRKLNRFGRKMEPEALNYIKENLPDVYEASFKPVWKTLLFDPFLIYVGITAKIYYFCKNMTLRVISFLK